MSFFMKIQQQIPTLNLTRVLVFNAHNRKQQTKTNLHWLKKPLCSTCHTISKVVRFLTFSGLQKKQHLYLHWILLISLGAITVW